MNKKENTEYRCTNRQGIERREKEMINIHDIRYTFVDEYYEGLKQDFTKDFIGEDLEDCPKEENKEENSR